MGYTIVYLFSPLFHFLSNYQQCQNNSLLYVSVICIWIFSLNWLGPYFSLQSTVFKTTSLVLNRDISLLNGMDTFLCSICQGWLCWMGPFPLAWQSLSMLISVWAHRTARLGWFFNDFIRDRDRAVRVPTVTFYPNHGKLIFFFFITGTGCVWVRNPTLTTKTDLNPGNLRRN